MTFAQTYQLAKTGMTALDLKHRAEAAIWAIATYYINDANASAGKKDWARTAFTNSEGFVNTIWPLVNQNGDFVNALNAYLDGDDATGDPLLKGAVEAACVVVWGDSWA